MIKAFAPRELGGCSWVLLSIALIGGFPLVSRSQTAAPKSTGPAEKPPANDNPAEGEKSESQGRGAVVEEKDKKPIRQVEIFRDPRAENLLAQPLNAFKQEGRNANRRIIAAVKAMAGTQGANVERPTIEQFVDLMIYDLTNHSNIRAVFDPGANVPASSPSHQAIKNATNDLIEPILLARAPGAGNDAFLRVYNQVLLQKLKPLLSNHLLPRTEASIVLSQTGNPNAVDLFIEQLKEPDQTLWVNLSMLRGLTNIQQFSRYNLDARTAIRAAKEVSDFLAREKDLPWWLQYRALEALGSLRQASLPSSPNPEMATTATQFLTDPKARLEVRAEAGWALGMMQVPGSINDYNYAMLAHSLGDVAVALGERVRETYSSNPIEAAQYSSLLMSQIYQAFEGIADARESGLLKATHPSANQSRAVIKDVFDRIKPVAAAAVKLGRDTAQQAPKNLADLEGKTKALKGWLEKNPPANASLVPHGPKFPVNGAQLVNAPGGAAHVANGRAR